MAHTEEQNRRQNERRAAMRKIIEDAKRVPCADCGGDFPPVVMDFDHRGTTKKVVRIADWPRRVGAGPKGIERLHAEMAECDVVCANCHRIRHADEMNNGWRGERSNFLPSTSRSRVRGAKPSGKGSLREFN